MTKTRAKILQKIVFEGKLQLDSPLMIGSGTETEQRTNEADIHILKDKRERPFIPGTSLAGVLRDWMASKNEQAAKYLFGFITKKQKAAEKGKMDTDPDLQSAVAVSDVILEDAIMTVRDGVHIDTYTGTGIKGHKYDYEVVERGTKGNFYMVITVRVALAEKLPAIEELCRKLADRLFTGIQAGALTTKGFGAISVPDITINFYNFHSKDIVKNKENVKCWLLKQPTATPYKGKKFIEDDTKTFAVDAQFALRSSLLIRDQDVDETIGDAKLTAKPMESKGDYLIPGTSLKGVLRHQAVKILDVLNKPESLLDDLMGYTKSEDHDNNKKGRFIVSETYIKKDNVTEYLQTRNRIDRFTGGTIESALFTNRVLRQTKPGMAFIIHYEIKNCEEWEAGLALLLLKDLWTGKITIGGEKSIGRGMLQGISATISFKGKHFEINREEEDGIEKLKISSEDYEDAVRARDDLEKLVQALVNKKGAERA